MILLHCNSKIEVRQKEEQMRAGHHEEPRLEGTVTPLELLGFMQVKTSALVF